MLPTTAISSPSAEAATTTTVKKYYTTKKIVITWKTPIFEYIKATVMHEQIGTSYIMLHIDKYGNKN